jgi:hypothetical protein
MTDSVFDGVFRSDLVHQEHTGELFHNLTQPSEDLILAQNAELRKNEGVINDLGAKTEGGTWGRQVASIPFVTYYKAIKDGYSLNCKDSKIATREMHRFLLSEEGKKCLVR